MSTRGPDPMITETELKATIKSHDEPFVTAQQMSSQFGVARQTAWKHLQRLHNHGDIEKKKIGSSAVIWWVPS